MRTLILVPLLIAAATVVPVAGAEPQCLQVYPWSELCQGDVDGFLHGMGIEPTVECIAMSPWWELCNGDVEGFAAWWLQALGDPLSVLP